LLKKNIGRTYGAKARVSEGDNFLGNTGGNDFKKKKEEEKKGKSPVLKKEIGRPVPGRRGGKGGGGTK